MRIYPAISLNGKLAMTDSWLPQGGGPKGDAPMLVRKGQMVVWFSWASHRNPEIFGEDVETFRPERWENLSADIPGFIPFQPGTRVCPGRKFAVE
jgi:cytochrome P450